MIYRIAYYRNSAKFSIFQITFVFVYTFHIKKNKTYSKLPKQLNLSFKNFLIFYMINDLNFGLIGRLLIYI